MRVHPAHLLDDCEGVWRERWAATPGRAALSAETERLSLVVQALVAYQVLCGKHGVAATEVFRRWPACTLAVFPTDDEVEAHRVFERDLARWEHTAACALGTEEERIGRRLAIWRDGAVEAAHILGWNLSAPHGQPDVVPMRQVGGPAAANGPAAASPAFSTPELRLGPRGASVHVMLGGEPGEHLWHLSADGEAVNAQPPLWQLPRPARRIDPRYFSTSALISS